MTKKYKLTHHNMETAGGRTLHQIKALKDFGKVKKGDLGGWIESYDNLSQRGTSWVYDNAIVCDDALVDGNAQVYDDAWVCGNADVFGNARVYGAARVYGNACVYDNAQVSNNAIVCDDAWIHNYAQVWGNAQIHNNAQVYDNALVFGDACIYGYARVLDKAKVCGNAKITGDIYIRENDEIKDNKSYLIFKNTWSSGRQFVYVLSNQRWHVGCFDGTGGELIKKAYADSELSGKMYESYVNFAEQVVKEQRPLEGDN